MQVLVVKDIKDIVNPYTEETFDLKSGTMVFVDLKTNIGIYNGIQIEFDRSEFAILN